MTATKRLLPVLSVLALSISAYGGHQSARALYEVVLPEHPHPRQVRTLEIAVTPCNEQGRFCWYRLTGTKVGGESYTIWFAADADPFVAERARHVSFSRYILQEPNEAPIEYVDGHTGGAMVPLFGFVEELLPRAEIADANGLLERGSYLGHRLVRREVLEPVGIVPPDDVVRLVFRTDLIVGTSRNFRDDGKGRKSRKDNYNFVPFTEDNYDEMIAAGINYFTARGEQVNWICRRPVFYDGYSPEIAFPEELYRPNFMGMQMFIDEPACRLAGKYPPGASLATAVEMIHEHIKEKLSNASYRTLLQGKGIDTGTLLLIEPEIPIWETYIGTSYYQLEANPVGIIQECRWRVNPNADSDQILMLQRVNEEFGVDIPVTPENLFTWFYSQMRGPARAFGTKWGMSIYGQAEPHLRFPSMKLAYDMGAEYIWLWTSDHDHHVLYTEQLSLARQISKYAKSQPRRDLDGLRRAAEVAVVLPYGYTLPTVWQMFTWGTHIYPLDRKNEHGITYKQVLAPAVVEIARCLKTGTSYDVVPAGDRFDPGSYKRVFRVLEDRTVHISSQ